MNTKQLDKVGSGRGLVTALDQSGGSTPKALALYGILENAYSGGTAMFDLMHEMRARIMRSPSFDGDRVLGAILFEGTMGRQVEGKATADYLWEAKGVVPFVKVDKGLAPESDGVQLMKPITDLGPLLSRATQLNLFGTKMRSFIKLANSTGIRAIVSQQFEIARQIAAVGLVPIVEPEIDIHSPGKAEAESLLKADIADELVRWPSEHPIMLKLTLPDQDNFYADFVANPKVLRVMALSGGHHRDQANQILGRNDGVIASFSRALTEGLCARQSDTDFDATLDESIASIYKASVFKVLVH